MSEFVPVSYTIAQIDDAIREIVGKHGVRPADHGWSRPRAMTSAAELSWINMRDEDTHSHALRSGLLDLEKYGRLRPSDGVFPE